MTPNIIKAGFVRPMLLTGCMRPFVSLQKAVGSLLGGLLAKLGLKLANQDARATEQLQGVCPLPKKQISPRSLLRMTWTVTTNKNGNSQLSMSWRVDCEQRFAREDTLSNIIPIDSNRFAKQLNDCRRRCKVGRICLWSVEEWRQTRVIAGVCGI